MRKCEEKPWGNSKAKARRERKDGVREGSATVTETPRATVGEIVREPVGERYWSQGSGEWMWGVFSGLATFRKCLQICQRFRQRIFPANLSALYLQGFRTPQNSLVGKIERRSGGSEMEGVMHKQWCWDTETEAEQGRDCLTLARDWQTHKLNSEQTDALEARCGKENSQHGHNQGQSQRNPRAHENKICISLPPPAPQSTST